MKILSFNISCGRLWVLCLKKEDNSNNHYKRSGYELSFATTSTQGYGNSINGAALVEH